MSAMRVRYSNGNMFCSVTDVPAFPEGSFGLGIPEAIGDAAAARWFGSVNPAWGQLSETTCRTTGFAEGELSYAIEIQPHEDYLDIKAELTNRSARVWEQSLAFNCFCCSGADAISDHECVRHYVGVNGKPRRLVEVPRVFGPRPTIQLYNVEGAPRGRKIPFVKGFHATPDVVLEGWMAIQSRDGRRLVAAVSKPALFLFQNMEYSCIHSAPGFGRLEPGRTGRALTRIYFSEGAIDDWYARMKRDLA